MEEIDKIAGKLYETYCCAVGGVAFNGDMLPNWISFSADSTKQKQVDAWRAVARRANDILCAPELNALQLGAAVRRAGLAGK